MNGVIEMAVAGVGLFTPGFPDAHSWIAGNADAARQLPTGELIPPRTRRRTSTFTRALADVYGEALAASGFASEEVAAVFGSALGEADTMIGILDQIFREGKTVSPMRFAVSVHNAAAGVVSLATKNRGFTTSLGADFDTPAMALAEAAGVIATQQRPVIVVCGDEQAPKDLVDNEDRGWDLLAAAIALAPARASEGGLRIRGPFDGSATDSADEAALLPGTAASARVARNPQMGLFDLVDAIQREQTGTLRLDRGRGRGLCVEVLGG